MRKAVSLLILFACFASSVYGQIGGSIGYSSSNFLMLDITYIDIKDTMWELDFTTELSKGVEGEDMSEVINWNEYPQDFESKGSYFQVFNIGVGFSVADNAYLMPKLGYAVKTEYKNQYDEMNILGDNGEYHITRQAKQTINAGLEFDYKFKSGLFLGVEANVIGGVGGSVGYLL